MPIYKEIKKKNTSIFIWKYHENDHLEETVSLDKDTKDKIKDYHFKRRNEVLMVRKILNDTLPEYQFFYHQNGEPCLYPRNKNISISHSFPFTVVAISDDKIGIDLEKIQSKMRKLKSRFLHKTEYPWVENEKELEYLTIVWTIKESLYKIHSPKYWSFQEHYEVGIFTLPESQNTSCRVFNEEGNDFYQAEFQKIEDYYLAIVKEI